MPVDGKFKPAAAHQSRKARASMPFGRDNTEVSKPFKQPNTLVVLSHVGFQSDQTLAGIETTVV